MKYVWYVSVVLVHHTSHGGSVKWHAVGVPIVHIHEIHASVIFHCAQHVLYVNLSTQVYYCITGNFGEY